MYCFLKIQKIPNSPKIFNNNESNFNHKQSPKKNADVQPLQINIVYRDINLIVHCSLKLKKVSIQLSLRFIRVY